jgi:hypothetical protein
MKTQDEIEDHLMTEGGSIQEWNNKEDRVTVRDLEDAANHTVANVRTELGIMEARLREEILELKAIVRELAGERTWKAAPQNPGNQDRRTVPGDEPRKAPDAKPDPRGKGKAQAAPTRTAPTPGPAATTKPPPAGNAGNTGNRTPVVTSYSGILKKGIPPVEEAPFIQVKSRNAKKQEQKAQEDAPLDPNKNPGEKRRAVIRRDGTLPPMPKEKDAELHADINVALKAAGAPEHVRVAYVAGSTRGNITLTAKAQATGAMLEKYKQTILRVAQRYDPSVTGLEANATWNRLKVNNIPLRMFHPGTTGDTRPGMQRLKAVMESEIEGLELPMDPSWLVGPERIASRIAERKIESSTVIITVKDNELADKLLARGMRLMGRFHTVRRYVRAGPDTFCEECCQWGHSEHNCGALGTVRCMFCADRHRTSDHRCKMTDCRAERGKLCNCTIRLCTNCGGNHIAKSTSCPVRRAAEQEARKQRQTWRESARAENPLATPTAMQVDGDEHAQASGEGREVPVTTATPTQQ